MAQIPRIVYFAQSGTINTSGNAYNLPISSAKIEVTRPIEGVNTFGHFGSLNTSQTNLTTCKSTLKGYMGTGAGGFQGFTAQCINDILNNTTSGVLMTVAVGPGGYTMSGILDNLGIEVALGGFGMVDLGFGGVGEPLLTNATGVGAGYTTPLSNPYSLSPITTMSVMAGPNSVGQISGLNALGTEVSGANALSGTYATSIKFTYSLPSDVLGSLGDYPDAVQGSTIGGQPAMISQMATKPPYRATITVEGYGVDPTKLDVNVANLFFVIGNIGIQLPHAKVNARGQSNAAGQVSETFSFSAEDFSANIVDTTYLLAAYGQPPSAMPAYGG
jgi:hypothetical protein